MITKEKFSRRRLLISATGAAAIGSRLSAFQGQVSGKLPLDEYQPKSVLQVAEHPVARARFPVIDVHTHLTMPSRTGPANEDPRALSERLDQVIRAMDELNLRTLVNLTGGTGDVLERNIVDLQQKYKGRFLVCAEPSYSKYPEPDFPSWQAAQLARAKRAGAVGLKVVKTLGLTLRERGREGKLVKIDDPRFDPMWEAAGKLNLPVFIHIADPDAFFLPIDRFNERYEEVQRHPDWSFHGKDFPSKRELLEQRNRVIERHPGTTFVGSHVANHPEALDEVSAWLDRYPNLHCDIAARISELGRQPRRAGKFFEDYQDRIVFGTDIAQRVGPSLYRIYFRFLETMDEYFDYAPNPVPPQGRWKIYGLGLPDAILKKVYTNNAARLLGLAPV